MNNGTNHLTELGAAQAGSNRRDWQYFDKRLSELRVNDVENIIERGRLLIEAHDELERGSYEATVKRHFDLSYARKLRIIATHSIVSNRAHVHALPPSVFTLYELTKLPAALLREKLADGSINPKLERKDVARWRQAESDSEVTVNGKAIERKPSQTQRLKMAQDQLAKMQADIAEMRKANDGGNIFTEKSSAEQIAESIASTIRAQPWKMREVAALLTKLAKEYEARIKAARPKRSGTGPDDL